MWELRNFSFPAVETVIGFASFVKDVRVLMLPVKFSEAAPSIINFCEDG
jgi:hypothetical protein